MVLFPHAKINLGLQVVEKRHDGFHNIISGLYPIGWSDVLEILPSEQLSFKATGLEIPGNHHDNLCLKAYQLLKEAYDIPPVMIHLHKVIPMGAGLGGGSSDAAFTLRALNQLFGLELSNPHLEEMAAELGGDCAFFIQGEPALATEKGDHLTRPLPALPNGYLAVVTPPLQVNTAEAYGMIRPASATIDLLEALKQPPEQWQQLIRNDFEPPVFEKHPEIAHLKSTLIEKGALYASMSGSGSSVFGIFGETPDAEGWFGEEHKIWVERIR